MSTETSGISAAVTSQLARTLTLSLVLSTRVTDPFFLLISRIYKTAITLRVHDDGEAGYTTARNALSGKAAAKSSHSGTNS